VCSQDTLISDELHVYSQQAYILEESGYTDERPNNFQRYTDERLHNVDHYTDKRLYNFHRHTDERPQIAYWLLSPQSLCSVFAVMVVVRG